MKTLYSILALCVIFLISSCNSSNGEKTTDDDGKYSVRVDSPRTNPVELSPNKLVVRFPEDMTDAQKEALRDTVFVTNESKCSCGDNSIVLWEIDTTKIKIEEAKSRTASNQGGLGVNGDRQFYFSVPDSGSLPPSIGINEDLDLIESGVQNVLSVYTGTSNNNGSRVNIAVVDTGFDFKDHPNLPANFLYETSNLGMDCDQKINFISGWNFVDDNADITDGHSDGHGTFVTKTLMRELEASDVAYSILPIKAFDGDGNGSYWDIICAFNYIKEVQIKNGDLHIVNASFGYSLPVVDEDNLKESVEEYNKESILAALITELENNTIIVASSGNDNQNTDEPQNAHFPSGFTSPRLISVGGYALYKSFGGNVSKKLMGNYGPTSVDLMAPYQHLFIPESAGNLGHDGIIKQGTSYSAPFTTAILAKFISNGNNFGTPALLRQSFLDSDFVLKDPIFASKVDEGRYIESDAFINNPYLVIPVYDNQVFKNADQ